MAVPACNVEFTCSDVAASTVFRPLLAIAVTVEAVSEAERLEAACDARGRLHFLNFRAHDPQESAVC